MLQAHAFFVVTLPTRRCTLVLVHEHFSANFCVNVLVVEFVGYIVVFSTLLAFRQLRQRQRSRNLYVVFV